MICQWCKSRIEFADCGKECPGITGTHRPDNRHAPKGDRCPCGRPAHDHRVSHQPTGNRCSRCGLPAKCHIARASLNRRRAIGQLTKRDGWKCQICHQSFNRQAPAHPHPRSVTIDHVVQMWKGGTDDIANLRLAHRICNMRRNGLELSPSQRLARERALSAAESFLLRSHPKTRSRARLAK